MPTTMCMFFTSLLYTNTTTCFHNSIHVPTTTNTTTLWVLRPIPTMYAYTMLRYNSTRFVPPHEPHEYSDQVGLLIQNRTTCHHAPELKVAQQYTHVAAIHSIEIENSATWWMQVGFEIYNYTQQLCPALHSHLVSVMSKISSWCPCHSLTQEPDKISHDLTIPSRHPVNTVGDNEDTANLVTPTCMRSDN